MIDLYILSINLLFSPFISIYQWSIYFRSSGRSHKSINPVTRLIDADQNCADSSTSNDNAYGQINPGFQVLYIYALQTKTIINYRSIKNFKLICFVSIMIIFVQDTTPLESSGTVVERWRRIQKNSLKPFKDINHDWNHPRTYRKTARNEDVNWFRQIDKLVLNYKYLLLP